MKDSQETQKISWAQPSITDSDYFSIKDCFDSNWISQGNKVKQFEEEVAKIANRKYCIAVNSGSSALVAALIALGISKNSEVIIPGLSYIAVPNAITLLGAIPVLADIDTNTGTITKETVSSCVSSETAAMVGIDYSGFANDWSDLSDVCNDVGIPLIVDAASSFLAKSNGKPAGSYGDLATFSFHAAKPITTGEGGAIVTDNVDLASSLKQIRNQGETPGKKYTYNKLGLNFRMTDISASLGISQLSRKNQILKHRHQIINRYLKSSTIKQMALDAYSSPGLISNGFTFTISSKFRDNMLMKLHESNVETRIMWPLIDQQPVYRSFPIKIKNELKGARFLSQSCLSLPVHLGLGNAEVDLVTDIIVQSTS